MPEQVRVNIRTLVNAKSVRKEKRNGRDLIIVPSSTLPDDIVMNGVQYPASEIERSYKGLNRTPAPFGHPMINGKFISARDPEGMALGWIGAWNENVRREDGRVHLDKVIDVANASQSEAGKRVLKAIEEGKPIHTSCAALAMLEPVTNSDLPYTKIARSLEFDHDAILLDTEGAATPDQGVGMLVNSQTGEQKDITVINSFVEDADRDMDWAVETLAKALDKQRSAGVLERLKTAIMKAVGGLPERELSANQKETDMGDKDTQTLSDLSAKIDGLPASLAKAVGDAVGTAVTNAVKPLIDAHTQVVANQKAKDDAELGELREKIVKANLMNEAEAKELTLTAARALAKKAEPGKSANLNSKFVGNDEAPKFTLPKAEDK